MDIPGPVELIIIAAVIMVLFGSKKMPDAARSMGRSLRIFKSEVKGMHKEDEEAEKPEADATGTATEPPAIAAAPEATAPAEVETKQGRKATRVG
jgi:sec-independent protein translocase protein TatA